MMALNYLELADETIAELTSEGVVIKTTQDALDILANAQYQGASHLIIYEHQLVKEFFDLKTGLAGDILQKFSNYQMKLTIVGSFEQYQSSSLKAFMTESNRGQQVAFAADRAAVVGEAEHSTQ
ncbi:MAG: DUF4180 domain-containing protein [Deinococcota bacterium]